MKVIRIDPAELGPKRANVGDIMTACWNSGYAIEYRFDGKRWVKHRESDERGQWPKVKR